MIRSLNITYLLILLLGMNFSVHASSHTHGQFPGSPAEDVTIQPAAQKDATSVTDRPCQSCCDGLQTAANRCVTAADSCCTSLEDFCFGKSN